MGGGIMSTQRPDLYDLYYADKLWRLLPSVYRSEDAVTLDGRGPLRELVERLAAQIAVVRRSIDRLWEDQSIESCDDWVIPYIADLLATNLVSGMDARGQRLDVAKTIYYRRRKGTVAILEEIAGDVTGWEAHVVEFFRRMSRSRHGLDPEIGLPVEPNFPDRLQKAQGLVGANTRTGAGGWADLRNRYGASRAHTAFDEFAHVADLRRGRGRFGWHNIPRLGVFLWRLESFGVDQATPVAVQGCADWYTFDPTGRDIPLFAAALRKETARYGDQWTAPEEWQLPAAIDNPLWDAFRDLLYPADPDQERSLGVFTRTAGGYNLIGLGDVRVDPERGRFHVENPPVTLPVFGAYHYGFSAPMGAGPYDRRLRGATVASPAPVTTIAGGGVLSAFAAGTVIVGDSLTYTSAPAVSNIDQAAVTAKNEKRPVLRMGPGSAWTLTGKPGAELSLSGLLISGGDVVLKGDFDSVTLDAMTVDPGSTGSGALFQKAADGRELVPSVIQVEGRVRKLTITRSITGPVRTRSGGTIDSLEISDSIVQAIRTTDLGALATANIHDAAGFVTKLKNAATPLTKMITGTFPPVLSNAVAAYAEGSLPDPQLLADLVAQLNIVIAGPALYSPALFDAIVLSPATVALLATNPAGAALARLHRLLLEDAFPIELSDSAIAMADGDVRLSRVSVLGRLTVHRIEASECILGDFALTEDTQRGCVRFSAWVTGSVLPRKYESVRIAADAPVFLSRVFGNPVYAQLMASADAAILAPVGATIIEGAQDGSEMGAFAGLRNPQKERGLLIKYEEFMPLGLAPVLVYET